MKKILVFSLFLIMTSVVAMADVTYSQDMYEKAVMGDREAMYNLSLCYMQGMGIGQDFDKSDYWLERAAQLGQPSAVAAIRALEGKTGLSDAKRRQLAAEEKRERERLQANRGGGGGTLSNQTFTVNGVLFTMVAVSGGTFTMDSDKKPTHSVTLSSYYIGQTEVTQELWEAVMGSNPSFFKGAKRPVENVSWNDCQKFISKLNQKTGKKFRLPTEAEWEYAARGGKLSQGYKYSGSNNLDEVAWYCKDGGVIDRNSPDYGTHLVASKRANELGIYDMSGNVYEWCQDWYSISSQTDPSGSTEGYYHGRGGCWCYDASYCRLSYCFGRKPNLHAGDFGFRLAL